MKKIIIAAALFLVLLAGIVSIKVIGYINNQERQQEQAERQRAVQLAEEYVRASDALEENSNEFDQAMKSDWTRVNALNAKGQVLQDEMNRLFKEVERAGILRNPPSYPEARKIIDRRKSKLH